MWQPGWCGRLGASAGDAAGTAGRCNSGPGRMGTPDMLHGSLHTAQAWKAAGKALPANEKYKSLVVQYYDISNL